MTGAILKHKISMFRYMFNGYVHLSNLKFGLKGLTVVNMYE